MSVQFRLSLPEKGLLSIFHKLKTCAPCKLNRSAIVLPLAKQDDSVLFLCPATIGFLLRHYAYWFNAGRITTETVICAKTNLLNRLIVCCRSSQLYAGYLRELLFTWREIFHFCFNFTLIMWASENDTILLYFSLGRRQWILNSFQVSSVSVLVWFASSPHCSTLIGPAELWFSVVVVGRGGIECVCLCICVWVCECACTCVCMPMWLLTRREKDWLSTKEWRRSIMDILNGNKWKRRSAFQ